MTSTTSYFQPTAQPIVEARPSWWSRLGQTLAQWFTPATEPTITRVTTQNGQTFWRAYNPRTQQMQWLESEAEVMLWLDSQPYC